MSRPGSPAARPVSSSTLGSVYKQTSHYSVLYETGEDPSLQDEEKKRDLGEFSSPAGDKRVVNTKLEDEVTDLEKVAPPDGGCLAWGIVAASFMVSFLQDGFRDSFGLLLPSVSLHFQTGRTEAAMTNSIMTFLTLGSGPLVAFLVHKIGHRNVTIIGVCMSSLGLLFAGFSIEYLSPPSLPILYLTVGLMTGLGFGFMYLPAMDIIELYFDRNLGLAMGIAAAGSGVGQLAMAPVIHIVQEKLGLAFTMILLAASVASAVFFAFMYRLPKKKNPLSFYEGVSDITFFHEEIKVVTITKKHEDFLYTTKKTEDNLAEKCKPTEVKEPGCLTSLLLSYASMLKSAEMLVLLLSHFLMHIAIFAAFSFTADRATKLGIDAHDTSHLLSIMGICNCIGRILFGKVLDIFRSKAFMMTTVILLLNALIITFSDYMTSFVGQAIYSGVFGATFGAYISSVVVILKIINKDKITDSLGVCLLVFALASLVGPAVVGQIYDVYGSYRIGFLLVGGLGVSGALLLPVVPVIIKRKQNS